MQEELRQSDYWHLVDERRASTRMQKDSDTDFATICKDDGQLLLAEVYNDSLGGVCLVLEDIASFPIESEIEVLYRSTLLLGIVRHIELRSDGQYLVGLECRPLD